MNEAEADSIVEMFESNGAFASFFYDDRAEADQPDDTAAIMKKGCLCRCLTAGRCASVSPPLSYAAPRSPSSLKENGILNRMPLSFSVYRKNRIIQRTETEAPDTSIVQGLLFPVEKRNHNSP